MISSARLCSTVSVGGGDVSAATGVGRRWMRTVVAAMTPRSASAFSDEDDAPALLGQVPGRQRRAVAVAGIDGLQQFRQHRGLPRRPRSQLLHQPPCVLGGHGQPIRLEPPWADPPAHGARRRQAAQGVGFQRHVSPGHPAGQTQSFRIKVWTVVADRQDGTDLFHRGAGREADDVPVHPAAAERHRHQAAYLDPARQLLGNGIAKNPVHTGDRDVDDHFGIRAGRLI